MDALKSLALIALALVTVAGCAHNPAQLTREQEMSLKTRLYTDASAAQVIEAAEKVLQLADPSDLSFERDERGFRAVRSVLFFPGVTRHHFAFTATEQGDQIATTLTLRSEDGPSGHIYKPSWAAYQLFYARLDSLLGRGEWWNCREANKMRAERADSDPTWTGGLGPLCEFADDNRPGDQLSGLSSKP